MYLPSDNVQGPDLATGIKSIVGKSNKDQRKRYKKGGTLENRWSTYASSKQSDVLGYNRDPKVESENRHAMATRTEKFYPRQ